MNSYFSYTYYNKVAGNSHNFGLIDLTEAFMIEVYSTVLSVSFYPSFVENEFVFAIIVLWSAALS